MAPEDVINAHEQVFPKSCPSSVMELVLKLHGKIADPKATPIQTKYGNTNVGFSKLHELAAIGGLIPATHDLSFPDAWALCEVENKEGRFPLISLPTESRKSFFGAPERIAEDSNHIFITVLDRTPKLCLVCHAFGANGPIYFSNLSDIEQQILVLAPAFKVNLATYTP